MLTVLLFLTNDHIPLILVVRSENYRPKFQSMRITRLRLLLQTICFLFLHSNPTGNFSRLVYFSGSTAAIAGGQFIAFTTIKYCCREGVVW